MARQAGRSTPCDGGLGQGAAELLALHGSLVGYRGRGHGTGRAFGGRLDLRGADLTSADLSEVRFDRHVLSCATLRLASLRGARLVRTDLRWADLGGADLRGASFSDCDLRWADLRDADLRDVRLGRASTHRGWQGCDLTGALLDGADLEGARYDAALTTWPEGFDPKRAGAVPE